MIQEIKIWWIFIIFRLFDGTFAANVTAWNDTEVTFDSHPAFVVIIVLGAVVLVTALIWLIRSWTNAAIGIIVLPVEVDQPSPKSVHPPRPVSIQIPENGAPEAPNPLVLVPAPVSIPIPILVPVPVLVPGLATFATRTGTGVETSPDLSPDESCDFRSLFSSPGSAAPRATSEIVAACLPSFKWPKTVHIGIFESYTVDESPKSRSPCLPAIVTANDSLGQ